MIEPALFLTAALALATPTPSPSPRPTRVEPSMLQAMEWRNIGPTRGGRVEAVAGIAGKPFTFYFGSAGGGVYKTEDAGVSWRNVTDGQLGTSSIGAIAVAESDDNVVFVGTGEAAPRGNALSHGDGVYKSTDAGKTWTSVGLKETRHISQVRIDPRNPDLVFVAALGPVAKDSKDRGVFKSADGGRTWRQTLFVDETTGAVDLVIDPVNPRHLYAAMWDFRRLPWQIRSGGRGSGLYKSTDGGETWKKLSEGLPGGTLGKIGVTVSPSRHERVWAVIEAEDGGLFRSDDAGGTWTRVNEDRVLRARSWYYMHIFAHPTDEDTVFVHNAPMLRVTDGGKSVTPVRTPHGDNHALWINPKNPNIMIDGDDGGASVTLNAGKTWSTQSNQITAQIYRVNTDESFPYMACGGQQDNSSVCVVSRSDNGPIDATGWFAGPGCESAYVTFDRKEPQFIYGGCYTGIIDEFNPRTNKTRNIMAYPQQGLSQPASLFKYRFNWNAPIAMSTHDNRVIYHAGNQLLRTRDRGASWEAISPDLTRNEKEKQGAGGTPITNEGAGAEVYGTIFAFAESPVDEKVLWAGTDDGLLHVSRDAGGGWANVTPPGVGEAQINAIDASPFDPATAYVAVTGYRRGDYSPMAFKTADYGKTWTKIVAGIPDDHPVRVVREDPEQRGLLYMGTEMGVFVSKDDGASWKTLRLNMPVTPVTDLQVRSGDLVASTQGRGFWILDDITPLRVYRASADAPSDGVRLLRPRATPRTEYASTTDPALGANPPTGVIAYYWLAKAPEKSLTLEVLDAAGRAVRKVSWLSPAATLSGSGASTPAPVTAAPAPPPPSIKPGLNRWVWNLRHEDVPKIPGIMFESARGHLAGIGKYTLRVTADGVASSETVDLQMDPRLMVDLRVKEADLIAAADLAREVRSWIDEMHASVLKARKVREQVTSIVDLTAKHPASTAFAEAGKKVNASLESWEESIVQSKQKTQQDVINFRNMLSNTTLDFINAVAESDALPTNGMKARHADLRAAWAERRTALSRTLDVDVAAFSALMRREGVVGVVVP